ncbi:MAG: hypothetical protein J6V72_19865 [Kiritimatiellae bacterium]|nr:hypothetical protein [Kiritimatiellia bacterium]
MTFLPDPATSLDYQTVFQIIATFEAFSAWKGRRAFKLDGFSDIGDAKPSFDNVAWGQLCDQLKECKHKGLHMFYMLGKLVWSLIKNISCTIWHWVQKMFLPFAKWTHKRIIPVLRATPIFTIPAISLAYLYQLGFSEDGKFNGTYPVALFIAAKLFFYMLCFACTKYLSHCAEITTPADDETGIDPVEPTAKTP